MSLITQKEIKSVYGFPNQEGTYLVNIQLPYPMRLAWDKKVKVNRLRCHYKVAAILEKIFQEILLYYGYERIVELGIDLFGGCFNFRKMRNGSSWSTHAWGISIDLHPEENRLRWGRDRAVFAKDEYCELLEIFERNGFQNLGRERNYDWMHFQPKPGLNE
jgi:hypothetical protein